MHPGHGFIDTISKKFALIKFGGGRAIQDTAHVCGGFAGSQRRTIVINAGDNIPRRPRQMPRVHHQMIPEPGVAGTGNSGKHIFYLDVAHADFDRPIVVFHEIDTDIAASGRRRPAVVC